MRGFRLLVVLLIVSPIMMLALSESKLARQPFAQVTAAPGPVPLTAPVAPGQPQAFSTIGALPALAAAPGTLPLGVASAVPTPRAFRCTCGAPGTWTEWAGLVSSSSYILASQSARGQCANYLLNANAASPFIPQEGSTLTQQRPTIYNGTAFTQRAQVNTAVGQTGLQQRSQESASALTSQCSRCACN
jgi:hypothetical protein